MSTTQHNISFMQAASEVRTSMHYQVKQDMMNRHSTSFLT